MCLERWSLSKHQLLFLNFLIKLRMKKYYISSTRFTQLSPTISSYPYVLFDLTKKPGKYHSHILETTLGKFHSYSSYLRENGMIGRTQIPKSIGLYLYFRKDCLCGVTYRPFVKAWNCCFPQSCLVKYTLSGIFAYSAL